MVSSELQSLENFKALSARPENHRELLKSKKAILFAATLLEREDARLISLCLEVFENFLENRDSHAVLLSTFGVYESLEALAIRTKIKDPIVSRRASTITDTLRDSTPPAFGTRSRRKAAKKRNFLYVLYVPNLTADTRNQFERVVVRIRGVISFLVDLDSKRCTLRLSPEWTIREVAVKISAKCGLKCLVVRKNKGDEFESFYDVVSSTPNQTYLEYPEELMATKSGTVAMPREKRSPSKLLQTVKKFWTDSFYW